MRQPVYHRDFETAKTLAATHALELSDPVLATLRLQTGLPGNLGLHARTRYQQRVHEALAALQADPFPTPPVLDTGRVTIGETTNGPFRLTNDELLRHVLIAGPSGSGKTTLLQNVALQLRSAGVHLVVPDYKADLQWLATTDQDFLIISHDAPLNILQHHPTTADAREEHIGIITGLLARSYYGGEHLRQVAHDTLHRTYDNHHNPSVADWLATAQSMVNRTDTYQRRDAINGLINRLQRYNTTYPGPAKTRQGLPHNLLATRSVYLLAPYHNETHDFLASLIITLTHNHSVRAQERGTLQRAVIIDEGLLTFGAANRIDGPVLLPLIPLAREHGTSFLITTAHLGGIHDTLRANTYTTIVLPLANATDQRTAQTTLGLNNNQATTLLTLTTGHGIVRTGKAPTPFRLTIPPPTTDKTVNETAWNHARQRTQQSVPPPTTETQKNPTVHQEAHAQPTTPRAERPRASTTAPPAAAPPTRNPAAEAPKLASTERESAPPVAPVPPVRLTGNEEALLRAACNNGITTVTQAYEQAKLSASAGDRALKNLHTLRLINKDNIIIKNGRGGTATSITPTTAAYERLAIPRPKTTRGGDGPQHEYLVTTIAKKLPNTRIEGRLGNKSIDLLTTASPQLLQLLDNIGTCLTPQRALIPDGSIVALEVETTTKTLSSNARQNLEAGAALTVALTLPKNEQTAKAILARDLPTNTHARIITANAITLLEAL